MDDGSEVLVFPRSGKGSGGAQSLDLITHEALDRLCTDGRTAILYTHWGHAPEKILTARGLVALRELATYANDQRIWVAPTHELLEFEFVRTFVRYSVRADGATRQIDIERVDNPVGEGTVPTIEELRGLSFEVPQATTVEVRLQGQAVPAEQIETIDTGRSRIVRLGGAR